MSFNGTQLTTLYAQQTMISAALGEGPRIEITHVALGDGSGAGYEPYENQTALRNELVRKAITRQHFVNENTLRVVVEFGLDIPAFWMREIGFFDATGNLIFVTAGADITPGYTSAFELIFDGYLNLSGVKDGLVVVTAPNDEVFDLALHTAHGMALLQLEQLRQGKAIRKAHGTY